MKCNHINSVDFELTDFCAGRAWCKQCREPYYGDDLIKIIRDYEEALIELSLLQTVKNKIDIKGKS